MPFIGQQPVTGAYHKLDSITTSATATYNLQLNGGAYSPASANHLLVSLNGVIQAPQDSFTVSGSTITFASALTASDNIDFIMAFGDVLSVGVPTDGSVNTSQLANSAVTDAKIAAMSSSKLTGALPALDGSALTGISQDMVLVSSGTISATTSITFDTSNFNGSYNSHVMILELQHATGSHNGSEVRLELSTDNGSSYLTGVASWGLYHIHSGWSNGTTQTNLTRGGNHITLKLDGLINKPGQYKMEWTGLNRASDYKAVTYQVAAPNHDTGPQNLNGSIGLGGFDTTTSSNHAMRITHSGGASMSGTYRIYGRT